MRQIVPTRDDPGGPSAPGHRPARIRSVTTVAALLGVLVTAVLMVVPGPGRTAATTDSGASRAPDPGMPRGPDAGQPPIYALVYSWTEAGERITLAQQQLITECMTARGFRYRPAAPATARDVAADRPTPFGLESLEPRETGEPLSEDTRAGGEEYGRALYGPPEQRIRARGSRITVSGPAAGCLAEAENRLLGTNRQRWMQLRILLLEAEEESRRRLDDDPEFRAGTAQWRECMRQAGFDSADPRRLFDEMPPETDIGNEPAARADVACKTRTGYLAIAYARLTEMQRIRLAEDPSISADWHSLLAAQDAVARDVLDIG